MVGGRDGRESGQPARLAGALRKASPARERAIAKEKRAFGEIRREIKSGAGQRLPAGNSHRGHRWRWQRRVPMRRRGSNAAASSYLLAGRTSSDILTRPRPQRWSGDDNEVKSQSEKTRKPAPGPRAPSRSRRRAFGTRGNDCSSPVMFLSPLASADRKKTLGFGGKH